MKFIIHPVKFSPTWRWSSNRLLSGFRHFRFQSIYPVVLRTKSPPVHKAVLTRQFAWKAMLSMSTRRAGSAKFRALVFNLIAQKCIVKDTRACTALTNFPLHSQVVNFRTNLYSYKRETSKNEAFLWIYKVSSITTLASLGAGGVITCIIH